MNIKIPYSWLTEFVSSDAGYKDIAKALSLCSASVERIEKINKDYIFDIEITTNRVDMLSVYGLAREAVAVLPRFGFKAKLLPLPSKIKLIKTSKDDSILKVQINNPKLCPRFSAVLIENVNIKSSPLWLKDRLEKAGVRSLNNVVDISNYCMFEQGNPVHTFDYDQIKKHLMILRESQKGEKVITLDGVKRTLPESSIIIEDGEGRIIDLCGIMGAQNSAVTQKTKNVLLFIQNYDPALIRRTCQLLSFRTDAAVRFEKGIDSEGVFPELERAAKLFLELTQGKIHGKALDIYPSPAKEKLISLPKDKISRVLGVNIENKEVENILTSLAFQVKENENNYLISVPSFRHNDINISEDVIEEIARIYGYFRLPSLLPEGQIPSIPFDRELYWENRLKNCLKYWGFIETYTFSLISENQVSQTGINPEKYLKLLNHLNNDHKFLRPTLLPSLLEVAARNQTSDSNLQIFEISMTYQKRGGEKLPEEKPKLGILMLSKKYLDIKGIVEQIYEEIGRKDFTVTQNNECDLFNLQKSAIIGEGIGIFGEIDQKICEKLSIKYPLSYCELDCETLFAKASQQKSFNPLPKYPAIIEDITLVLPPNSSYDQVIETIKKSGKNISHIEYLGLYQNFLSLRLYFQSSEKTLTGEEVKVIRNKILKTLELIGIFLKS